MFYELRKLFKTTGKGSELIIRLLLRCPFDAIRTITLAAFLNLSFRAVSQKNMDGLYAACIIFGIESLLLFLYNGIVWMAFAAFTIRWVSILRKKVFSHISGISLKQIEEKSSGEWFTRLNADVGQACAILNQPLQLPHAVVAVVGICVSAAILFTKNQFIFALVILFLIPHLLINRFCIAKPVAQLSMKAQEAAAANASSLNALITCADTAILYDTKDFLMGKFEESSIKLRKANMRIKKRNALKDSLLPMMGMSGYFTILLAAGTMIAAGKMTFSELTALFQYRGGVLAGSMMLTNCFIQIRTSLAGVRRVNETMDIKTEKT